MDDSTEKTDRLEYAKCMVEITPEYELLDQFDVQLLDGSEHFVKVLYMWKPSICISYKLFGHSDRMCIKTSWSSNRSCEFNKDNGGNTDLTRVGDINKDFQLNVNSRSVENGINLLSRSIAMPSMPPVNMKQTWRVVKNVSGNSKRGTATNSIQVVPGMQGKGFSVHCEPCKQVKGSNENVSSNREPDNIGQNIPLSNGFGLLAIDDTETDVVLTFQKNVVNTTLKHCVVQTAGKVTDQSTLTANLAPRTDNVAFLPNEVNVVNTSLEPCDAPADDKVLEEGEKQLRENHEGMTDVNNNASVDLFKVLLDNVVEFEKALSLADEHVTSSGKDKQPNPKILEKEVVPYLPSSANVKPDVCAVKICASGIAEPLESIERNEHVFGSFDSSLQDGEITIGEFLLGDVNMEDATEQDARALGAVVMDGSCSSSIPDHKVIFQGNASPVCEAGSRDTGYTTPLHVDTMSLFQHSTELDVVKCSFMKDPLVIPEALLSMSQRKSKTFDPIKLSTSPSTKKGSSRIKATRHSYEHILPPAAFRTPSCLEEVIINTPKSAVSSGPVTRRTKIELLHQLKPP